jgi:rubrerythrin
MAEPTDPIAPAHAMLGRAVPEPGRSHVEMLLHQFESHEREEKDFVDGYREIVNEHPNPMIRFLLGMIIADEERHHGVVHTIAASLKSDLEWSDSPETLHTLGDIEPEEKRQLLELTAAFIVAEKQGIKEYKRLARSSRGYYQGSFALLVKTIIHDSEKHLMILEFIDKVLKEN